MWCALSLSELLDLTQVAVQPVLEEKQSQPLSYILKVSNAYRDWVA